jgi:hypothetical protein
MTRLKRGMVMPGRRLVVEWSGFANKKFCAQAGDRQGALVGQPFPG